MAIAIPGHPEDLLGEGALDLLRIQAEALDRAAVQIEARVPERDHEILFALVALLQTGVDLLQESFRIVPAGVKAQLLLVLGHLVEAMVGRQHDQGSIEPDRAVDERE
jgi:hypothetical protein